MSKTFDRRIYGPLLQKQNQYGLWAFWPDKQGDYTEMAHRVIEWILLSWKKNLSDSP